MTDLTTIDGVGPTIADNLRAAGFDSVDAVQDADPEELAEVDLIGMSTARAMVGEDGNTRGRESDVHDHLDEIERLAKKPISDRGVIRLSDISWKTHKRWRNKDGEEYERYRDVWETSRGVAEAKLADEVAKNDPRFLLERAFDYTKEQKIEHEGDGLGPVRVSFTDDDNGDD
jgi:NAD-dependent DNA ligase